MYNCTVILLSGSYNKYLLLDVYITTYNIFYKYQNWSGAQYSDHISEPDKDELKPEASSTNANIKIVFTITEQPLHASTIHLQIFIVGT